MKKKKGFAFIALSSGLILSSFVSEPKVSLASAPVLWDDTLAEEDKAMNAWISSMDQHIQEGAEENRFPGLAVAIIRNNETALLKCYGVKKTNGSDPINETTLFRIASNSKGIAAGLAGILVNEGALDWDDKAIQHVPDLRIGNTEHSQSSEIQHLLSHSAGLPYHTYTNLVEAGLPIEDIIHELTNIEPIGPVGKYYAYQNAGYSIIAPIIEEATKKSFIYNIQEKLFSPLDMDHASVTFEDLINSDNVASPHVRSKKGWSPTRHQDIYYNAIPAGGVNASISDMSQWLKALLGFYPEVLPPHILNDLYTPRVSCPIKHRYFRGWDEVSDVHYGLGWRILKFVDQKVVYHGGYIDGYRSEIAFDPKAKMGICVLSNGTGSFPKELIKKFLSEYNQIAFNP